jgi:hypothetical protein
LERYKNAFPDANEKCHREEFMVWIDVYSIGKIRPHLYSTNFRIILGRKKWN